MQRSRRGQGKLSHTHSHQSVRKPGVKGAAGEEHAQGRVGVGIGMKYLQEEPRFFFLLVMRHC